MTMWEGAAYKNGVLWGASDRGFQISAAGQAVAHNAAGDYCKIIMGFILPDLGARTAPISLVDISNNAGGIHAAIVCDTSTAGGALGRGICMAIGNTSRRFGFGAPYAWAAGRHKVELLANWNGTSVDHEIWIDDAPVTVADTETDSGPITSPIIAAVTSVANQVADDATQWLLSQIGNAVKGATAFATGAGSFPAGGGLEYLRIEREPGIAALEMWFDNPASLLEQQTAEGSTFAWLDGANVPDHYAKPSLAVEYRVNAGAWTALTDAVQVDLGDLAENDTVDLRVTNNGGTGATISAATEAGDVTLTDDPSPVTLAAGGSDTWTLTLGGSGGAFSLALTAEGDSEYSDWATATGADFDGEFTFGIAGVNDPPVVTCTGSALAYTEDDGAVAIDPGLTLADADDTEFEGATVEITGNYASGQDVLTSGGGFGVIVAWDSGTGTLTLTGTATVAQYQTILRAVKYNNNSGEPSELTRTVTFTVDDGDDTGSDTRDITVTAGEAESLTPGPRGRGRMRGRSRSAI